MTARTAEDSRVIGLMRALRALPKAALLSAGLAIGRGFIREWAKHITYEKVKRVQVEGKTVFDLTPGLEAFLVELAVNAPAVLDRVTLDTVLDWAAAGNPGLVQTLWADQEFIAWAARTWREGVAHIRQEIEDDRDAGG